jgi:hypothetical protein
MTPQPPPRRVPWLTALLCGLLGSAAVGFVVLRSELAALRAELAALRGASERTERLLRIMRFEQPDKSGMGMAALVAQIREFAPLRWAAQTTPPERDTIVARLEGVVDAMRAVDREEAWHSLQDTFRSTEAREDTDETVHWLLAGMIAVDSDRAKPFLIELVRGLLYPVTPRTRLAAADRLAELDRELAGETLKGLLEYESAGGINSARMPRALAEKYPNATLSIGPYPGFFNFVRRYYDTAHRDRESVLLMLVARQEHDLPTVQECVKLLGEMRSRNAVRTLEKLFAEPPAIRQNAIFRRHCLDALSAILGDECCGFVQESLQKEQDPLVRTKLVELVKQHCQDKQK